MSGGYPWILFVPTCLMIVFCLGAMIYVAMRPSEYSRPKRYALTGLAIMLFSQFVFPMFFGGLLIRFFTPTIIASGVMNILVTATMMFAVALLIAAVFVDRNRSAMTQWNDPAGTPLADRPNDNPYAAPRQ